MADLVVVIPDGRDDKQLQEKLTGLAAVPYFAVPAAGPLQGLPHSPVVGRIVTSER